MSKRRSPEQWRSILSAFHRSGRTQAQFCLERGLSVSSLQYQLRRERSGADEPAAKAGSTHQLLELTPSDRRDVRPGEFHQALRVECSLDSRVVSIDCHPGQVAQLLVGLSTFHDQRVARR